MHVLGVDVAVLADAVVLALQVMVQPAEGRRGRPAPAAEETQDLVAAMVADLHQQPARAGELVEELDDGRHREDRLVPVRAEEDRYPAGVEPLDVADRRADSPEVQQVLDVLVGAEFLEDLPRLVGEAVLAEQCREGLEGREVPGLVLVQRAGKICPGTLRGDGLHPVVVRGDDQALAGAVRRSGERDLVRVHPVGMIFQDPVDDGGAVRPVPRPGDVDLPGRFGQAPLAVCDGEIAPDREVRQHTGVGTPAGRRQRCRQDDHRMRPGALRDEHTRVELDVRVRAGNPNGRERPRSLQLLELAGGRRRKLPEITAVQVLQRADLGVEQGPVLGGEIEDRRSLGAGGHAWCLLAGSRSRTGQIAGRRQTVPLAMSLTVPLAVP